MTIDLKNYNAVLIDPTIEVVKVEDNLEQKVCSVHVRLSGQGYSFTPVLYGFTYSDTWEDADIETWVSLELTKYES